MRKFFVLLKKEIKELFTLQMFVPIILMAVIFMLIGSVMGDAVENAGPAEGAKGKIYILDKDSSELSNNIINELNKELDVTRKQQGDVLSIMNDAKSINANAVLVIPENFQENIENEQIQYLEAYSMLKSLSIMGSSGDSVLYQAVSIINNYVSNKVIEEGTENKNPDFIKNPVMQNNFVVVNGKAANVSSSEIQGFVMTQNIFIPVVILMIIIYSAQLLISTLAAEKENKTMETLLSTPVKRSSIIGAKMTAAGLSALVYAVVFMFGFQFYMGGMMNSATKSSNTSLKTAMEQLGLTMGVGDYILLGISLFASILVALALASVLGTLAEDAKKAQGYISPIMLLVMVPYFLTIFIDINSTEFVVKLVVNLIPFAHPFQATSFLFMGQYVQVILGILYQAVLFAVLLFVATKIYSSDKIFMTKHSSTRKAAGFIKK